VTQKPQNQVSNAHNTSPVPENSLETVHGNILHISNDYWQKGQLEPKIHKSYISESHNHNPRNPKVKAN